MVWLVANESSRPMASSAFPAPGEEPLPIAFQGLDSGFAVYEPSATTARLKLRGVRAGDPGSGLDAVVRADVRVWADLSSMDGADTVTVPLHAECTVCGDKAVRIASIAPEQVTVKVERAVVVSRTVEVVIEDNVMSRCRRIEAVVDPAQVTARGATSRLDRVTRIVARITGVDPKATTVSKSDVAVAAVDVNDQPVPDVVLAPPTVDVQVSLVDVDTCAEVAVLPVYAPQNPAEGYYVADIGVEPSRVEVEGPPDRIATLRDLGTVSTQPVDIRGAQDRVTQQVALDLPEGIDAVDIADGVTVTIQVSPYPGTRTFEVPVTAQSVPPGLEVTGLAPQKIQVFLGGPLPILEALDADQIQAVLDLTGREAGAVRIRPRVEVPSGLRVRSTVPSDVDVRLNRIGVPTALAPPGG
jgi:YbbR domain-containing protein